MKTLIFDLDETLIHCLDDHDLKTGEGSASHIDFSKQKFDMTVPIKYNKHEKVNANIFIRPGAQECLKKLKNHFEIVIFTASHSCYANKMIDILDPKHELITYRVFRDNCFRTEDGCYVKDLRIFANRSLNSMLLVDNAAYSFGYQLENGVPILPFYCDKSDRQLFRLTDWLMDKFVDKPCRDVRENGLDRFGMQIIKDYASDWETLQSKWQQRMGRALFEKTV